MTVGIEPARRFNFWYGDGYDFQEKHPYGRFAVPGWGRDGWDAASWPLTQVGRWRNSDEGLWLCFSYVEGDVDVWEFDNPLDRDAKLDGLVMWGWMHGHHDIPKDSETYRAMNADPANLRFRGPFTWKRLSAYQDTGVDPYELALAQWAEGRY
jgi:hypothetical protein